MIVGAGADGVIDLLSQATLDAGDEIVCGWPSFPSYVLDALKLGAVPRKVPLRDHTLRPRRDARRGRAADEARVRLPSEQPDGDGERTRRAARVRRARCRSTCSSFVDQAYFEYVDDPDYADGVAELFKQGRRVVVLRTFSKIYGLAGLRVGYGIAPADVVDGDEQGAARVRRRRGRAGGGAREPRRRRRARAAARAERDGREELGEALRANGLEPAGPALGNFLYVEVGGTRPRSSSGCCAQGVIVRPLARLRRAGGDSRHRRHARGERLLRALRSDRSSRASRSARQKDARFAAP